MPNVIGQLNVFGDFALCFSDSLSPPAMAASPRLDVSDLSDQPDYHPLFANWCPWAVKLSESRSERLEQKADLWAEFKVCFGAPLPQHQTLSPVFRLSGELPGGPLPRCPRSLRLTCGFRGPLAREGRPEGHPVCRSSCNRV